MKIAIAGYPRSGKSTLADELSIKHRIPIRRTDDIINDFTWERASDEVAKWFNDDDVIIEGMTVPRGLRKWIRKNKGKPCDILIWLDKPYNGLSSRQLSMGKSSWTILDTIMDELRKRGTLIMINEIP